MAHLLFFLYATAACLLLLFGLNCYVMIFLFVRKRRKRQFTPSPGNLSDWKMEAIPRVTIQIPLYNEANVASRILYAAANIRYPKGFMDIQVLDDSTDETRQIVDQVAAHLRQKGTLINIVRRSNRTGFKAGALSLGLETAPGELLAIFDADFVPPPDFLERTVPFFKTRRKLGFLQARWGHLNEKDSLLTRAQAIGIDGHFAVEQAARCWNHLFLNFNGTAGLWRHQTIVDAGGWQWDTLTEDMDLSYRAQLCGWHTEFLADLIVPGELPTNVHAFKSQQFRWAKGSIQTARKLLPTILKSPFPLFKKWQAIMHLCHYTIHPLMVLLALLAYPVLVLYEAHWSPMGYLIFSCLIGASLLAPQALYTMSLWSDPKTRWQRYFLLPSVVLVGVGVALSNSKAVLEALLGITSPFVRTPKSGDTLIKNYRLFIPLLGLFELLLGLYCIYSFHIYWVAQKFLVGPFLCIYAAGFLFIGALSALPITSFSHPFKKTCS